MTNEEYRLRKATLDWMVEQADCYTHAVTLTMKQELEVVTERGAYWKRLTAYDAKANLRHFINRLNATAYGNAVKRYGKSIAIWVVLEGQATNKDLHYHCAIGRLPENWSGAELAGKIRGAWMQTDFGDDQMCIERIATNGWLSYMGNPSSTVNRASL